MHIGKKLYVPVQRTKCRLAGLGVLWPAIALDTRGADRFDVFCYRIRRELARYEGISGSFVRYGDTQPKHAAGEGQPLIWSDLIRGGLTKARQVRQYGQWRRGPHRSEIFRNNRSANKRDLQIIVLPRHECEARMILSVRCKAEDLYVPWMYW